MSFSTAFAHPEAPHDRDRATLSNYRAVRTTHVELVWAIDWERKLIGGTATLDLTATQDINEVVLDTSFLDIRAVTVGGEQADYVKDERIGAMGEALHVKLAKPAKCGEKLQISVDYSTTEQCTAVGWLEPVQTKSGKYPYLYSQSQAIHGRSLFPCQDTPAIKATYASRVTSTLPVLMSGLRQSPPPSAPLELGKEVEYTYDQPVAIPSYLVAIASGEVAYRPFQDLEGRNWRTGVWAEPGQMDEAYWEFEEDTAKQVAAAEDLTSDYRFGVYDFLILPKSFPYGGMENCCLTFATPTLLAHDRSLVDVIAHEISHSWFGNSIGCASWSHFWLNEGWTTYLERLVMRKLEGEKARQLSFIIGRTLLRGSLAENKDKPRFQRMLPDYEEHEDPDEGYSQVPYEKGANFLLYLERLVGGVNVFVPYMKSYVQTFTDSAITTDQWRAHLFDYFGGLENGKEILKKLSKVDWDAWLHGSGPDLAVDVDYDDALARPPLNLAARWTESRAAHDLTPFSPRDIADFSSTQLCVFLDKLDDVVFEPRVVRALDDVYKVGKSGNAEVRLRFYKVALKAGSEYADVAAEWVTDKGRMKFNRPIYRLLVKQAPDLARSTFEAHKAFYHPIARKMIAKDLGVDA